MSLAQQAALDDLAQYLYDFLTGKPHPYAHQNLSFPGVANELGLGNYWPGRSKQPAIRSLLGSVIAANRDLTSRILKIVEGSITYRKRSNPLTREHIDRLNEILLRVGYKIPELHELAFLSRLPLAASQSDPKAASSLVDSQTLAAFQKRLLKLSELDPHPRGYAFQEFLSELFHAFGLAPRAAFRLRGEEIDGSFSLNNETYLLEAKWQNEQVGQSALNTFQGKVEGKAQWSRGLFVSYSGFSKDGLDAFAGGRRTSIICRDGLDLSQSLSGTMDLIQVLTVKSRRAAETVLAQRK